MAVIQLPTKEHHIIRKGVKHSWKKEWRKEFISIKKWKESKSKLSPAELKALVKAQSYAR